MLKNCPICAAPGDDLVFKFECTNPDCQNFVFVAHNDAHWESEHDDDDTESSWPWGGPDFGAD